MGTHCAPTYATIVLLVIEQNSKISYSDILFMRRYIDDILIIAASAAGLLRFIAEYESVNEAFKLTSAYGNSCDFMNLTITVRASSSRFIVSPYAKKFNKHLYLPFSSHHPMHMKKAFVKSLVITQIVNSGDFHTYKSGIISCYNKLRARGYPLSLLWPIFTSMSYANRQSLLAPKCPAPPKQIHVLNLPYNSIFSAIPVGKLVHKHFDSTLPRSFTVLQMPVVAWSRTHNVGDILNISRKRFFRGPGGNPNNPNNVISDQPASTVPVQVSAHQPSSTTPPPTHSPALPVHASSPAALPYTLSLGSHNSNSSLGRNTVTVHSSLLGTNSNTAISLNVSQLCDSLSNTAIEWSSIKRPLQAKSKDTPTRSTPVACPCPSVRLTHTHTWQSFAHCAPSTPPAEHTRAAISRPASFRMSHSLQNAYTSCPPHPQV